MRICFYAPFKPLGHPHPSGDLVIAHGLHDFLSQQGHQIIIASELRTRWIFWKPWLLPKVMRELFAASRRIAAFRPDLWLTYHTYYKAPDILGPALCRKLNIPYLIFQGIYATKQRRTIKGFPGFHLNRLCLLRAQYIFTNRRLDQKNLLRIIPEEQLRYIPPGIFPEMFCFNAQARLTMRRRWQVADNTPVLISAAMFRPDVKTEGLIWMLKALQKIASAGKPFKLVIAGDGSERRQLETLAARLLPDNVVFVGKVAREEMFQVYSGGDLFVFPGIRESLGMVYLEAQSCGLPVIAFDNGGIPEVVAKNRNGFLTKPFDEQMFCEAILSLLADAEKRQTMGNNAAAYIRQYHDLHKNYLQMEKILLHYATMA